jgi:hypothetical protein
MRKFFAVVILLTAAYHLPSAVVSADESNGPKPAWLTDYHGALETARQTGKPLFVVFRCPH